MFDNFFIIAAAAGEAVTTGNPITDIAREFHVETPYLIAQIFNFLVVAFLLYRFAFKPVFEIISERQKKIADGLQYAEEMKSRLAEAEKQKAETLKKASLEATNIVSEAREQAKLFLDRETQEIALKTAGMVEKGQQAIAIERDNMLLGVRQEVTQLVVQTTAKVLDRELSDSEKAAFSESAARELAAQN